MHININSAHSVQNSKSLHTQTWFVPIVASVVAGAPLLSWTFPPRGGTPANDLHDAAWVLWRSWHPLNTLYRPIEATLTNGDVTTPDDTVAGSGRPKNRTCCVLGMDSSTPLLSTHYPIPQMKNDVWIVGVNVAWTQRQKSVVNGTRLRVQSGKCSVNIDWSRILSEFAGLLKELRIGEEEGTCTIHKFMLHCNCSWTIMYRYKSYLSQITWRSDY